MYTYLNTAEFQHIAEKVLEFLLLCLHHIRERKEGREREGEERGSTVLGPRSALLFLTMAVEIGETLYTYTYVHVHMYSSLRHRQRRCYGNRSGKFEGLRTWR